jgi:methyl-accepting chemotaxis protein
MQKIPFLKRLQVRLIVGFSLFAYLPTALVGYYAYVQARGGYEEQVIRSTRALSDLVCSRLVTAIEDANAQLGVWASQKDTAAAASISGQQLTIFNLIQNRLRTFLAAQRDATPLFSQILVVKPVPTTAASKVLYASQRTLEGVDIFPGMWKGTGGTQRLHSAYRWKDEDSGLMPRLSPFGTGERVLPIAREFEDTAGNTVAMVGLVRWQGLEELVSNYAKGGQGGKDATHFAVVNGVGEVVSLQPAVGKTAEAIRTFLAKKGSLNMGASTAQTLPGAGRMLISASSSLRGWRVIAFESELTAMRPMERLRYAMLIAAVLVLAATLVLGLHTSSRIASPVRRLAEASRKAATGDLQIAQGSGLPNDEIGALAKSFGTLVEELRTGIAHLKKSVEWLTSAVLRLEEQAGAGNQAIQHQATALNQARDTVQHVTMRTDAAATKAASLLKVAERTEMLRKAGEASVQQSLSALSDIRASVTESSQAMEQLNMRTDQISQITSTVKSLADHANMLALNAAVQAVHAGEHGRGFRTVAHEFRNFSKQAIEATERVREMLNDATQQIRVAVQRSAESGRRIDTGLAQVKLSGENMAELAIVVRECLDGIEQIAQWVEQQKGAINMIATAVNDQENLMEDTVRRLGATHEAATLVKDASAKVAEVAGKYRV